MQDSLWYVEKGVLKLHSNAILDFPDKIRISYLKQVCHMTKLMISLLPTLREKCPNTELFMVRIFLYSARIQKNTDQK